jgi:hypothetical protein
MAKAKTVKAENTEVAVNDPALAALAARAAAADTATRSSDGMNVSFVSVCQATAKALDDTDTKMYIPGLAQKDFYIQAQKMKLGKKLRVIPLAFLSVYNEFSGPGQNAKFLGVWHKDDAERFDLCPGSYYNRELPNGHELRPVKWVAVFLPDFPEVERAVITFKSTATKIAKDWAKDIESRKGSSFQFSYLLSASTTSNDKGKWFEIEPVFEKELFTNEDGKFTIKDPLAKVTIEKSLELNEAYANSILIRRRSQTALIEAQVAEDDDDGDDNDGTF